MNTLHNELLKLARFDHIKGFDGSRATVATLVRDGKVYAGVAYVNPKDNFSRYVGRMKATGRLAQLVAGTQQPDSFKYFCITAVDEQQVTDARGMILDDVLLSLN